MKRALIFFAVWFVLVMASLRALAGTNDPTFMWSIQMKVQTDQFQTVFAGTGSVTNTVQDFADWVDNYLNTNQLWSSNTIMRWINSAVFTQYDAIVLGYLGSYATTNWVTNAIGKASNSWQNQIGDVSNWVRSGGGFVRVAGFTRTSGGSTCTGCGSNLVPLLASQQVTRATIGHAYTYLTTTNVQGSSADGASLMYVYVDVSSNGAASSWVRVSEAAAFVSYYTGYMSRANMSLPANNTFMVPSGGYFRIHAFPGSSLAQQDGWSGAYALTLNEALGQ